jgi:NADPH-dependent 2,4-dienoyl-CoA reductase/sulfur reductase-like enzyme
VSSGPSGEHTLIVGASLAGIRAAESLRRHGAVGPITVLGAEHHRPYDRPPLSKSFLAGDADIDRLSLTRSENALADLDIAVRTGVAATSLNVRERTVATADASFGFDRLVIATGTSVRRLPHPEGAPVFSLRTLDDALALRERLTPGARVVVIGAGFIGAEVASTANAKGCVVTVVEALPVALERQLGTAMGAACSLLHERHGVTLRTGIGVASIEADRVVLDNGEAFAADTIVVGIGVTPNVEWLAGSGVAVGDGVLCNETCRVLDLSGAPIDGVVACGDVARWPNALFGEQMRIEHWTNAAEMADHAARTLLGESDPFRPVPYFWSDQYGAKIQFLGRSTGFEEVRVVDGDPREGVGVALYRRGERLIGALGLSRIKAVMGYRPLLADSAPWADALAHAGVG